VSDLVEKGLKAKRESKYVDFKRAFDPAETGEWCELIKDFVAMANSGGGVILIGLENGGAPSGVDVQPVLDIDHAVIVDKLRRYTGDHFSGVEVHEAEKDGSKIAIFEIAPVTIPIVFQNAGTYQDSHGRRKTAFNRGTVYFRHGAKSEPGTSNDLRAVVERQLEEIRRAWLEGVTRVVKAPSGAKVAIVSGEVRETDDPGAAPIRLVDDPDAPGYRVIDHDTTYPYRQKELLAVVNAMLPEAVSINSHDLLSVRRVYAIDKNLTYAHAPKFASRQYSDAFAQWLVAQHKEDPGFFAKARRSYYERTYGTG